MRSAASRARVAEIDKTVKLIRASINDKIREEKALLAERQKLTGVQSKTGRGPKQKGKTFEREIVASIRVAFPQLSPNDVLARSMGDHGADIILSEAARKVLPLAIECKRIRRVEDLDLAGAMEQALANRDLPQVPCVIYREDRHEAVMVLRLGDFAWLLYLEDNYDVLYSENNDPTPISCNWADFLKFWGDLKNDNGTERGAAIGIR